MSNVGTLGLLVGTIKLTSRTLRGLGDGFVEITAHAARARQLMVANGSAFVDIWGQCQALLMSAMGRKRTLEALAKITAPTLLRPRHEIGSNEHRIGERLSKLSHLLIKYH